MSRDVLGFDVALVDGLSGEVPLDNHVGLVEALVHVANRMPKMSGDIACPVCALTQLLGLQVVQQDRRTVLHRFGSR